MLTVETIKLLQQNESLLQASLELNSAFNSGRGIFAVPNDIGITDLESKLPRRRRARGLMQTSTFDAFKAYVEGHREDGACVFVSEEDMTASAVLNLGTPDAPGHADQRANLKLVSTAAFKALRDFTNHIRGDRPRTQVELAEFMEDWAGFFAFRDEAGAFLNPGAVIASVRRITIESAKKVETSAQQLSASQSTFDSIKATGAGDSLPTGITFTCESYRGLASRHFDLRLSVIAGEKAPGFLLRVVNPERHAEEMANEFKERINGLFGGALPVLVGEYAPGK